jgi:hypothetical protein
MYSECGEYDAVSRRDIDSHVMPAVPAAVVGYPSTNRAAIELTARAVKGGSPP